MKKWYGLLIIILILSLLLFPACAAPSSPATKAAPSTPATATTAKPQYGGVLKIIARLSMSQLGAPAEGSTSYQCYASPAMQDLIRQDRNWHPLTTKSTLIESFDVAPDGKTMTLRLRQGVKFHDGTACNAEAVKYNMQNYAPNKVVPSQLKNITAYNVIDDYTLKLNFNEFDPYFLSILARGATGIMASPAALKVTSTPENIAKDHMVGTGAFKFVSWQRENYIKYEKWAGYWEQGKPYLDAIEFNQVIDPVTSLISFKKGEAQVIVGITPKEANDLKAAGYQIVISDTMPPIACLTPDGGNPNSPWANKKAREAMEYAIDKKAIADGFGVGYYTAVNQFAAPGDERNVAALAGRSYDPAKARQLMTEAGYPNGFKTRLIGQTSYDRDLMVAIQTYLNAVGINTELDIADANRFSTFYREGWENGIMMQPQIGMNLSGMRMYLGAIGNSTLTYKSSYRPAGWVDKVNQAIAIVDDSKRLVQEKELVKMLSDEAIAIPLYSSCFLVAQDKSVQGLDWGWCHNYVYEPQNAWLSK